MSEEGCRHGYINPLSCCYECIIANQRERITTLEAALEKADALNAQARKCCGKIDGYDQFLEPLERKSDDYQAARAKVKP